MASKQYGGWHKLEIGPQKNEIYCLWKECIIVEEEQGGVPWTHLFGGHLGPIWGPILFIWGPFGFHLGAHFYFGPFGPILAVAAIPFWGGYW